MNKTNFPGSKVIDMKQLITILMLSYLPLLALSQEGNVDKNNAVKATDIVKKRALAHFANENYQQAFQTYKVLAELGDKFSQHQLALIYENGFGEQADYQQALAWAFVAAEKQTQPALASYWRIKNKLGDEPNKRTASLGVKYLREHGIAASSRRAYDIIRRKLNSCSGARRGALCDRMIANNLGCNTSNQKMPSDNCLTLGIAGVESIQRTFPLSIKSTQGRLRKSMADYKVDGMTFGEFQEVKASAAENEKPSKGPLRLRQRSFGINGFDKDEDEDEDEDEEQK